MLAMPASAEDQVVPAGEARKVAGLLFLALVQFRILFDIHQENLFELAQVSLDLLNGTPHHPAFQNRLLGPAMVLGWSRITGASYHTSHTLFLLLLTIGYTLTAFIVVRRLTGSAELAFRHTVYILGAALALLSVEFIFIWDFIDLWVFLVFAYGVFSRKPLWFFGVVYAVGLLNRESALAIAVWLMIDAFADAEGRLRRRAGDLPRFVTGAILLAIGLIYTVGLRQWLFVKSSLSERAGYDLPILGNQFNLGESVYRAAVLLLNPNFRLAIVIHLSWILLAVFLISRWPRFTRYRSVVVVVIIMMVAVPIFGFFDETRQYLYLVPLLVMLDLAARERILPPPGAARRS